MYVQCPRCEAVFRVRTRLLTQAEGMVRCGECEHVFNAMDTLLAVPPEAPATPPEQIPLAAVAPPAQAGEDEPARDIPSILAEDLRPARAHGSTRGRLAWGLASLLLIATLAGQYTWYERETLYRYPALQAPIDRLCELTGCTSPQPRDVSRVELVNRHVYSHPNIEGALMITATVVNRAPHPQPYPLLGMRFSDLQGQSVAARRFLPEEYLASPPPPGSLMEPGVPAIVNLEIVDPGERALSFEFDFL
ncbi:MAG: zinc-ribbon domain-containing protein [Chromatiales bacterium]|nr:zinc-ribbon domain-containing protein [Chromatiales bacterium]